MHIKFLINFRDNHAVTFRRNCVCKHNFVEIIIRYIYADEISNIILLRVANIVSGHNQYNNETLQHSACVCITHARKNSRLPKIKTNLFDPFVEFSKRNFISRAFLIFRRQRRKEKKKNKTVLKQKNGILKHRTLYDTRIYNSARKFRHTFYL